MTPFQKAKADGKWKSLKLTFMRNEAWMQWRGYTRVSEASLHLGAAAVGNMGPE
jgi:hypothetical protein